MTAVALALLSAGGLLLVIGVLMVAAAPVVASRVASTTTRPTLARRASGPERMRTLIGAQRTERGRRTSLASALTRTGVGLAVLSAVSLLAGVIAWVGGY